MDHLTKKSSDRCNLAQLNLRTQKCHRAHFFSFLVALLSSWPGFSQQRAESHSGPESRAPRWAASVNAGCSFLIWCFRCLTLCLREVQNALNWLLAFVLHQDSITRCYVLIRALPSGSPQLHFYVHLNVSRAMTHAAELFFFVFFFFL